MIGSWFEPVLNPNLTVVNRSRWSGLKFRLPDRTRPPSGPGFTYHCPRTGWNRTTAALNPAAISRTFAHDLTRYDATTTENLLDVLKGKTVDPGRPDIALQFKFIIQEALVQGHNHFASHTIPVIVIDASVQHNSIKLSYHCGCTLSRK